MSKWTSGGHLIRDVDIKLGKPQPVWLPEFYVHTRPADLARTAPIPVDVHEVKSHFRVHCAPRVESARCALLPSLGAAAPV